jgi:Ca2+:H+ antiporter
MGHSDNEPTPAKKSAGFLRTEFPLFLAWASAAFFLWLGGAALDNIPNPLALTGVFLWLLVGVVWSAISVVRHADCLAVKTGEPYGTLILTLSAITIEVITISAAVLHGANNPTLARDMMFGVVMIALNGLVGLSLLLGGLRHHEQYYNLQGTSAYLNTIMALAVLGLVLPNYTTSYSGPRFSTVQEVFLVATCLSLYSVFLMTQTRMHRSYFVEAAGATVSTGEEHNVQARSLSFHTLMLFLYLLAIVILAEKFAIPLDNLTERFGMPQAVGGAIVAALVLAPEALTGIHAAMRNQLQRSVNILHGSVLATIGLTIPAVLVIGIATKRPVTLGIEGANLPLLLLTLAVSIVTFGSGRTSVLQGCIHLLLFGVFLLLIFCP